MTVNNGELSAVAKALAWEHPYQASLATRVETLKATRDGLKQQCERLQAERDALLAAVKTAAGYMRNASIDLSTGAKKQTAINTIEGGLALIDVAIAAAEGRDNDRT